MKQTIGYDRQELESNLRFMLASIERSSDEIRMMEEQGLGLRENLDWQSTAFCLRVELERIKRSLNNLNVIPVSFVDLETREHYNERYLPRVTENYVKEHYEGTL